MDSLLRDFPFLKDHPWLGVFLILCAGFATIGWFFKQKKSSSMIAANNAIEMARSELKLWEGKANRLEGENTQLQSASARMLQRISELEQKTDLTSLMLSMEKFQTEFIAEFRKNSDLQAEFNGQLMAALGAVAETLRTTSSSMEALTARVRSDAAVATRTTETKRKVAIRAEKEAASGL